MKSSYWAFIVIVILAIAGAGAFMLLKDDGNGGNPTPPPIPEPSALELTVTASTSSFSAMWGGNGWIEPGYGLANELRVSDGSSVNIDDSDFYGYKGPWNGWKVDRITISIKANEDVNFDINKIRLNISTITTVLFGPVVSNYYVPEYPTSFVEGFEGSITVYTVFYPPADGYAMTYYYDGVEIPIHWA